MTLNIFDRLKATRDLILLITFLDETKVLTTKFKIFKNQTLLGVVVQESCFCAFLF